MLQHSAILLPSMHGHIVACKAPVWSSKAPQITTGAFRLYLAMQPASLYMWLDFHKQLWTMLLNECYFSGCATLVIGCCFSNWVLHQSMCAIFWIEYSKNYKLYLVIGCFCIYLHYWTNLILYLALGCYLGSMHKLEGSAGGVYTLDSYPFHGEAHVGASLSHVFHAC